MSFFAPTPCVLLTLYIRNPRRRRQGLIVGQFRDVGIRLCKIADPSRHGARGRAGWRHGPWRRRTWRRRRDDSGRLDGLGNERRDRYGCFIIQPSNKRANLQDQESRDDGVPDQIRHEKSHAHADAEARNVVVGYVISCSLGEPQRADSQAKENRAGIHQNDEPVECRAVRIHDLSLHKYK